MTQELEEQGRRLQKLHCNKCGYEWNSRSTMIFTTCPCCRYNVKRAENMVYSGGIQSAPAFRVIYSPDIKGMQTSEHSKNRS